jgi:hypothetical protein
MRNIALLFMTFVFAAAGCASRPAPLPAPPPVAPKPPPPPPPPPPKMAKLAVLPVEKLLLPQVAQALNDKLGKASVAGVGETTTAPVSMEVALMQIDCAQATAQCYGQIAKQFEVDRLLWAQIERTGKGKKKKTGPAVIRVFLFDVERAAMIGQSEETFPGKVGAEALDQLLARALTPGETAKATQP